MSDSTWFPSRAVSYLPGLNGSVDSAPNDARIVFFGVADLLGFVDFLAGQADVGGGFDFQRVGLRAECGGVTRLLRAIVVRAPMIFSLC
jgi:hypothetical protein